MKKLVLSLLIGAASCLVFAQNYWSFGLEGFYAPSLGSEIEDSETNTAFESLGSMDQTVTEELCHSWAIDCFARYQMPFYKPLGVQANFGYIDKNGCSETVEFTSIGDVTAELCYKSLELSPLVTYGFNVKDFYFTAMAGPNFSFPLGKAQFVTKTSSSKTTEFDFETVFSSGLRFGIDAGWKCSDFIFFLNASYICDFNPVEISSGGKTEDFITRRIFLGGAGIRYLLK